MITGQANGRLLPLSLKAPRTAVGRVGVRGAGGDRQCVLPTCL